MNNSIGNFPGNNLLSSTEQTSKVKEVSGNKGKDVDEAKSQAVGSSQSRTDEVLLTDSAQRLQAIERELDSVPAVDKAKVESVQARIADGSFEIDANSIAEKLLATDELLT